MRHSCGPNTSSRLGPFPGQELSPSDAVPVDEGTYLSDDFLISSAFFCVVEDLIRKAKLPRKALERLHPTTTKL